MAEFRRDDHGCLNRRADALFELTDAVLCADGPVVSLPELSLAEHRRGHGALYDGLACGHIDLGRLRLSLTALPLPRDHDGRITLTVDVSPWLRPHAPTSPDRMFCHVYGRGKGSAQMVPGWPYSLVAALETGRTSWTMLLDARRLGPYDDPTEVTAAQVRQVVERIRQAGQHRPGDPDILVVFDAGYDVTRLAYLLTDLPVELVGRVRSDRVFHFPAPAQAGALGIPAKHGPEFALADSSTHPEPDVTTTSEPPLRQGPSVCVAAPTPPLRTSRSAWRAHDGELPIIEGTLIRLTVDHCPATGIPNPCGCGPPARTPNPPTWTGSGECSCAASTSNTPSGSSSKPWAGPAPGSAHPSKPTAGPG